SVFNSGTITSSNPTSIQFDSGVNTLTLGPGWAISGNVVGVGSDTLQLGGSGTGSFDVSKIGASAQLQGFATMQKIGGSTFALTGTPGVTVDWTVTGGLLNFASASVFSPGQSITLNGGGLQWATGATTDISGQLNPLGSGGGTFDTNGNNVSFAT